MDYFQIGLIFIIMLLSSCGTLSERPPNVVFIIMDDVGMGDIGCFGNDTMKTPNIDQLAREGAKLTHHVAFPMCTPSRAALMTGRYPIRYGLASQHLIRVIIYVSSTLGLPGNETTIAELLKDGAGYATGLIGKWHLGSQCDSELGCSDPNSQGFDYFYGIPLTNLKDCGEGSVWHVWRETIIRDLLITLFVIYVTATYLRMKRFLRRPGFRLILTLSTTFVLTWIFLIKTMGVMNCILMENKRVVEQPFSYDNLNQRLTHRATSFIERNQNQPFFLVMSHVQAHTEIFSSEHFVKNTQHGLYGAAVEEIDWSVGQLMETLQRLKLDDNTFVYLTSDNGAHVEERDEHGAPEGGWNGIYKGGKTNTYEGGIRLPTIIRYPRVVQPGTVIDEPTHMADLLPTIANLTGLATPTDKVLDGKDITPLLKQEVDVSPHEFMYHYCGNHLHAVRYRPREGKSIYKVHFVTSKLSVGPNGQMGCFDIYPCRCWGPHVNVHNPPLVYDLSTDPAEEHLLDPSDPYIQQVIDISRTAKKEYESSVANAPYQYTVGRIAPRPWFQPCCNGQVFPFCNCRENDTSFKLVFPSDDDLSSNREEIMPEVPST